MNGRTRCSQLTTRYFSPAAGLGEVGIVRDHRSRLQAFALLWLPEDESSEYVHRQDAYAPSALRIDSRTGTPRLLCSNPVVGRDTTPNSQLTTSANSQLTTFFFSFTPLSRKLITLQFEPIRSLEFCCACNPFSYLVHQRNCCTYR